MVGKARGLPESSPEEDRTAPLYHAGIAGRDGHALQYVKNNTPPGPMLDLVKFFAETRQNLSITPAYRTTLTDWQLDNFAVMVDKMQWDRISFAKTFRREVEDYRFITFDLEMRHDEETEANRSVLAHFATASGRAVMFDLEQMAGGNYVDEEMVLRDLPPLFRQWLRSEKIYTVGSAIGGDEKRIGFRLGRKVDMRDIFLHYRAIQHEGKPVIDIGETVKSGFGIQAWYAKGMDYKPMTVKKHTALYGQHDYRGRQGRRQWPDFKHWSIYKWKRDESGNISRPGQFYNFHDSTCAPSCVASIFLDMAAGPSIRVQGHCSVADGIEAVLGPVELAKRAGDAGDLEEGEVIDNVDQIPSAQGSEASGTITVSSAPEEIVLSTSPSHSEDGLSLYEEEGLLAEDGEEQPPEKKARANVQDPSIQGGIPNYKAFWDRDVDRWNPYERNPVWGRRCEVCGVGKHAGYNKEGKPMCPMVVQKIKPVCLYSRCGKSGHKTIVCEKLHQICPVCWHRGHDRLAGCAAWGNREWARARTEFEAAAPLGYFTMRRHHNERWGYWPAVFGTPFPYPLKYRDLLSMTVAEADKALSAQRVGVAVSAGGQAHRPVPSTPQRPAAASTSASTSDRVVRVAFPRALRLGDRLGPRQGSSGGSERYSSFHIVQDRASHPGPTAESGSRGRRESDGTPGPSRARVQSGSASGSGSRYVVDRHRSASGSERRVRADDGRDTPRAASGAGPRSGFSPSGGASGSARRSGEFGRPGRSGAAKRK